MSGLHFYVISMVWLKAVFIFLAVDSEILLFYLVNLSLSTTAKFLVRLFIG